ncbi:MAG: 50S ribosomal protein L11 methyltransferase [Lachnospiraceae bacterium]|nr:50S ribosomal protein L11 methyltransferase [Lachnospiraceae bacterium]
MEWKKFTILTLAEAEDLVAGMLTEMGYTGFEIEDERPCSPEESGGLFGDVVPEFREDNHEARISFYTDADAVSGDVIKSVSEGLAALRAYADVGDGRIEETTTKEEDWINKWKEHFHAFRVDDVAITPTWEAEENSFPDAAMVLRIDPGTAFGTGAHESTRLAIRALRKYTKKGDMVLDIGTGSGILGIVALKSGASHVFGTDLDPNTLPAIEDNLRQNGISDADFERVLGNIADDSSVSDKAGYAAYDIVAANIIAEILREITPAVPRHIKPGGLYITSGILTEKEQIVIEAAEKAGFKVKEIDRMGEWSGIVFSYRPN